MARSTLLATGVLAAALTAGGAAGLILGTPSISGAQSTTTQDDGTTTTPDDGATTTPDEGTTADDGTTTPPADGERPDGCAEGEGAGPRGAAPGGVAPGAEVDASAGEGSTPDGAALPT
jgi:hypothetical protein